LGGRARGAPVFQHHPAAGPSADGAIIPESKPLTVMRSRRVSDVLLLLLRLAAIALVGFALAGAHLTSSAPQRVVLLDASRAVASQAAATDSAIAVASGGPIIVVDSIARTASVDSIRRLASSTARGSLSAGLVAAQRAVAGAADGRELTELVSCRPWRVRSGLCDRAPVALWEGPVRLVRVAMATPPSAQGWKCVHPATDPVAASLARVPHRGGSWYSHRSRNSDRCRLAVGDRRRSGRALAGKAERRADATGRS